MNDEIHFGDIHEPAAVLDPRSAWLVVSNSTLNELPDKVVVAYVDQGHIEPSGLLQEPIAGYGTAYLDELLTIRRGALSRKLGELPRGQWDSVTIRLRSIFGV